MKKFASLLLCLVLALCLGTAALADGGVSYAGQAEKFIFTPGSDKSPTDLFEDFKNVMPGDSLTEQIVVKNTLDATEIKVYLRSKGEVGESTEGFLEQLALTVSQNGGELFNATADETAGLTDWVLLGTFQAGEETTLDLTLSAPIEMGNTYANAVGYIDWEFMVEDLTPAPGGSAPQTGDDSPVLLYGALVLLCVAALVVLLSQRKKSKAD